MTEFSDQYLSDDETLDWPWVFELIESPTFYCLQFNAAKVPACPIGLFWLSDGNAQTADTAFFLHFLIRPVYLKRAVHDGLFESLIDFAFQHALLNCVWALFKSPQSVARKILERLGFQYAAINLPKTKMKGNEVDQSMLYLQRQYWEIQKTQEKRYDELRKKELGQR